MKLIQVKNNTYCIDVGSIYVPFYRMNENDIILLDSGDPSERDIIESVIVENNFNLKGILNTHGHPDHVGNNHYLKEKYNCVIAMPKYEANICSSSINLKACYNNYTLTEVEKHYGFMIFQADEYITEEQEEINFCGVDFKIMQTPGHSPSHICITTPDDVCYVADALLSYEKMENSKIPSAFIILEDLKSKDKLLSLKCSKYIIAHKGIYDDITNLIADNIKFFLSIAEKTFDIIEGKMTMGEITKKTLKDIDVQTRNIYKHESLYRMLRSYVDYLYEIGRIKLVIDEGFSKYVKTSS